MFDTIERMQADVPWGRVLDAGTGVRSLRWLRGLDTTGITAVTASGRLAAELRDGVDLRPPDAVVVGNWADPRLLHEERFDTVIADYVVGAIEIHAPYFQARFLERLRTHVTGRLYLTGIAPHGRSVEPGAARIAAILDLRDVAFVLLGARPYREYPLHWVRHALHRAGFRVDQTEVTQVRADEGWVRHQVDGCRQGLSEIDDAAVAEALTAKLERLSTEALDHIDRLGPIAWTEEWCVGASVPRG